jgi:hypothetical protein
MTYVAVANPIPPTRGPSYAVTGAITVKLGRVSVSSGPGSSSTKTFIRRHGEIPATLTVPADAEQLLDTDAARETLWAEQLDFPWSLLGDTLRRR